jgi:nucleoporin POM152
MPTVGRDVAASTSTVRIIDIISAYGPLGFLYSSNQGKDPHLLGQHTVRMSPISTAQLNPYADTFCLGSDSSSGSVLIPVLLNNTNPIGLRYTLTPIGFVGGVDGSKRVERVDLNAKDLKAIEQLRLTLELTRATTSSSKLDIDDPDYDEYADDEPSNEVPSSTTLQKSQTLTYIRLSKPGVLRLERVLDTANVEARLMYPLEVTVAPCPRAEFVPDEISRGHNIRCAAPGVVSGHPGSAAGEDLGFSIDIFGVPPLSLRWFKDVNGKREYFMVEGIDADQLEVRDRNSGSGVPQKLRVPLTVSLDAIGTHLYELESITDRFGNAISVGSLSGDYVQSKWRSTRSVTVLRRPKVSFKTCGPGTPSSLIIGSETPLTISTHEADPLDSPWDVTVKYQPAPSTRHKSWTRTIKSRKDDRGFGFRVNTPGDYTILDVKGKYCEGDVLSPEVCKVMEMSYPTAEIEWKKIHEWYFVCDVSALLFLKVRSFTVLEIPAFLRLLSCTGLRPSRFITACSEIKSLLANLSKPSQHLGGT